MTRRRWIAEHWDEATATIVGAQAEHLARVLRAQPGMEADVVAGGRVFHAEVAAVTLDGENSEVRFNLAAELMADPALPITLVLAIYKFDRMEWAIEKATELGVARYRARHRAAHRKASGSGGGEARRALAPHRARSIATGAPLRCARRSTIPFHSPSACARLRRLPASCLPSRSAQPPCVDAVEEAIEAAQKQKCPRSKSPSVLKADGLPLKRRFSTPMAGVLRRSVRASCALKPRPSLRWPSSPPCPGVIVPRHRIENRRESIRTIGGIHCGKDGRNSILLRAPHKCA